MKNKQADTLEAAVAAVKDGDVVLVGGFGATGVPEKLIDGLCERGLRDLTIVTNNAGTGRSGIARLIGNGCVSKLVCSFPWAKESFVFKEFYDAGKIALEIVPQGTLAERMRTAGAGLGGILTPTGVGTDLADGKQMLNVEGRDYVLELPLRGNVALCKADRVDPRGNLTFHKSARNFNPVMAMAADFTVVEVREAVGLGDLDPEHVITPGVFVDSYFVTGFYEIGKGA